MGLSPELEIAIYTIGFLMKPNKKCTISLGGKKIHIKTHTLDRDGKTYLATAYPDHEREENDTSSYLKESENEVRMFNNGKSRFTAKSNSNPFYKTKICRFYRRGYCFDDDNCQYAHGSHELRKRKYY